MGQVSQSFTAKSFVAGASLSAKQYYAVKPSAGTVVIAATAGEAIAGILVNEPSEGAGAEVVAEQGQIVPWIAGGSVTAGDDVTTDASGKCVTLSSGAIVDTQAGSATDPVLGRYKHGVALTTAASGELCRVLLAPNSIKITLN